MADPFVPSTEDGNDTGYNSRGTTVLIPDRSKPWSSGGYSGIPSTAGYTNRPVGVNQAQSMFLSLGAEDRKVLNEAFLQLRDVFGYRKPRSLWNDAVEASGDTGLTPWQIIEQTVAGVKDGTIAAEPGTAGAGGSGGPRAFTNTTVDLTNPEDAQIIAQNALSQYLGRNATDSELENFTKMLRKEELASPQVESGVASKSGTTATRTGGVSQTQAADMAKDFAQSRPDYAEFQASTTFLDSFINILENKGRLV